MRRVAALFALALLVALALIAFHRRTSTAPTTKEARQSSPDLARLDRLLHPLHPLYLSPVDVADDGKAPAGAIAGHVLASGDGAPIAHATLSFFGGSNFDVSSDEAGAFRFAPPVPGVYELVNVSATGFVPFTAEPGRGAIRFTARAGVALDGAVIHLARARSFTVVVRDTTGQPLSGVEVRAFLRAEGRQSAARALSDDQGQADLQGDDFDLVEAEKSGYERAQKPIDRAALITRKIVLTLVEGSAAPLPEIGGVVVDASGQPVPDAWVEASAPGTYRASARTVSDAGGRFTLSALDAGAYVVRARAEGRGAVEKSSVPAGERNVELRLVAQGGVQGTVSDDQHKPVASFTVAAAQRVGSFGRGETVSQSLFTNDGHYELLLPPGDWAVRAFARGWGAASEKYVTVGAELTTLDFALTRGKRVFGSVIDRVSGAAVAGARVLVEGSDSSITTSSDTVSDAAGSFTLDGVASGRQSIEVTAPGHDGKIVSGIDTSGDGDVGPVTVALRPIPPEQDPQMELVGIGIVIGVDPLGILVKGLAPGGGAAQVGMVVGDTIAQVDGTPVETLGFAGAVQMLRGPENSTVDVTVKHSDGSSTVYTVPRKPLNGG